MQLREDEMPNDVNAEQCFLGSVLIDTIAFDAMQLAPDDFYKAINKNVYRAMLELWEANEEITIQTVYQTMQQQGHEEEGLFHYLSNLSFHEGLPSAYEAPIFAQAVKDAAIHRNLIYGAGQIAHDAYHRNPKALENAETLISSIANGIQTSTAYDIQTLASETFADLSKLRAMPRGQLVGVPTGFHKIDYLTGGLQAPDLVICAGRPGMGKSAFALSIAYHAAAIAKKRVLLFSLEMSKKQLMQRMIAMDAQVDSQKLRIGRLDTDEWERTYTSIERLSDLDDLILIDDEQGLTPLEMRSRARRLHAKHPLDIIMVDYLQRMEATKNGKRIDNRYEEVSEISNKLKSLAMELNVPVLAMAQLNREVEKRLDKRPQMSDLNESGKIEQDADIIMFLYRDDYYNKKSERPATADVIVAKHRNGACDDVMLHFEAQYTQFSNIVRVV